MLFFFNEVSLQERQKNVKENQRLNELIQKGKSCLVDCFAEIIQLMSQTNRYESETSVKKKIVEYTFTPSFHQIQRRELTRNEKAARDLFTILHTLQKRKEFRAFEQFQFYSDKSQRGFVNPQGSIGEHRSKSKRNDRSKSVGLYAEYSRARLLKDIVSKLKAKHELSDYLQEDDIVSKTRIMRLQKMLEEAYENNTNISKDSHEGIKMTELLKETAKIQQQNNHSLSNKNLEETSKLTYHAQLGSKQQNGQRQNFEKFNSNNLHEHSHKYQIDERQTFTNHNNNYERVRYFVSPGHQFSAPSFPIHTPTLKPNSQMPTRQRLVYKQQLAYSNKQQQTASQRTAVSPRNFKGINVLSQLPFKKRSQLGSQSLEEPVKPASHFVEPFQRRDQPSTKGNYCDRCGRYCKCSSS